MGLPQTCPIFADGQKICEATHASYTVDSPVRYRGVGRPGRVVVDQDPPEYTITAELPPDAMPPITHESHVECAFPPSVHDRDGWMVIEVWEIHQYEISPGTLELSAWDGEIHTDIPHLGSDCPEAAQTHIELDDGFEANIHNI